MYKFKVEETGPVILNGQHGRVVEVAGEPEDEATYLPLPCSYETPATIRAAFERCKMVMTSETGGVGNINMSSIATKLIQNVGRFAESYASDFLIDWKRVEELIDKTAPDDSIVVFGIRKSGVDHTAFLMSRLKQTMDRMAGYLNVERDYRKVLAVQVVNDGTGWITAILKDITTDLYKMEPVDMPD